MGRRIDEWAKHPKYEAEQRHAICRQCHAPCCSKKNIHLALYPEDPLHRYRRDLVFKEFRDPNALDLNALDLTLRKVDGACVYLVNGKCSVYNNRPLSCRSWFCGRGTKYDRTWRDLTTEEERMGLDKLYKGRRGILAEQNIVRGRDLAEAGIGIEDQATADNLKAMAEKVNVEGHANNMTNLLELILDAHICGNKIDPTTLSKFHLAHRRLADEVRMLITGQEV